MNFPASEFACTRIIQTFLYWINPQLIFMGLGSLKISGPGPWCSTINLFCLIISIIKLNNEPCSVWLVESGTTSCRYCPLTWPSVATFPVTSRSFIITKGEVSVWLPEIWHQQMIQTVEEYYASGICTGSMVHIMDNCWQILNCTFFLDLLVLSLYLHEWMEKNSILYIYRPYKIS